MTHCSLDDRLSLAEAKHMTRIKSILISGSLCMALLTGSASLAWACGNPMIYPLLFRAYPEARLAYHAELGARRTGDLSAAVWSKDLGQSYHQWSLMRARKVVNQLAARLHRAAQAEAADFTVSILLAAEVYVAQLQPSSREVDLKPLGVGHSKRDIGIYTTANALRALMNGKTQWQEAVERDLVVLGGPARHKEKLSALLGSALSEATLAD